MLTIIQTHLKILLLSFLFTLIAADLSHGDQPFPASQKNTLAQEEQVVSASNDQTSSELDEDNFLEEEPFISSRFDYQEVTKSADALTPQLGYNADALTLEHRITQEKHAFYEVMILAVMAVVSLTIVLAFMKCSGTCQPRDMVTTAGLILIIFSTIILVLVASSEEQITAAIGVLGAIAGYLFGTSAATRRLETKETPSNKTESNKNKESQ